MGYQYTETRMSPKTGLKKFLQGVEKVLCIQYWTWLIRNRVDTFVNI